MQKYGQYCPVARAAEILGDRWTLLIVRDLLVGARHFNDLQRGLPNISRALLAERLRRLQRMGVVEKYKISNGRQTTEYRLTEAGRALQDVIDVLTSWGARYAFGEPEPEELDPLLLLWWMRGRIRLDQLPPEQIVLQIDFYGAVRQSFWLVLARDDVSICLNYPGFDVDVLMRADLATFYQVWLGRLSFDEAQQQRRIEIEAIPTLANALPGWFKWSPVAYAVLAARTRAPLNA